MLPQVQQASQERVDPGAHAPARAEDAPRPAYRRRNGALTRARCWVFTLWDNVHDPAAFRPALAADGTSPVDYICAQQETAPHPDQNNTTGGLHWQGYIELADRYTAPEIKAFMRWTNVWMEPRLGPQLKAIEYTKKLLTAVPGTWFQAGTPHAPDASGGWQTLVNNIIHNKANLLSLAEDETTARLALQYATGAEKLIGAVQSKDNKANRPVKVICYYGPTGTGKTFRARKEMCELGDDFYKKIQGQWWCGYEGQKILYLDEFYGDNISQAEFLMVIDEYSHTVNVRNSTRAARWNYVFITSNVHPCKWYPRGRPEHIGSMMRRIEVLEYMGDPVAKEAGRRLFSHPSITSETEGPQIPPPHPTAFVPQQLLPLSDFGQPADPPADPLLRAAYYRALLCKILPLSIDPPSSSDVIVIKDE